MQKNLTKSTGAASPQRVKHGNNAERFIPEDDVSRTDFLLDVAAQAFLEKGFEATSVGEIARRAHASKETFYNKFTNKNELFRAVMRRVMGGFGSDISSALSPNRAPQEALTKLSEIILERMVSDEGIGVQNIVFLECRRFPEIAAIFYELGPRPTGEALAGYFDAQVKKGVLRHMDSRLAAAHFMGLLTSDITMLRSLGLLRTPTPEQNAKRIRAAVEVFLRAYGPER